MHLYIISLWGIQAAFAGPFLKWKSGAVLSLLAPMQLLGIEEEEEEEEADQLAESPARLRKCLSVGGGAQSPFSASPQSISDAFLRSSNKPGNLIS